MIGYGENVGSGFPLIIDAWRENNWGDPIFVEQPELIQVKLTLARAQNVAKDVAKEGENVAKDVAKEGENVPKNVLKEILSKLTDRQKDILLLIEENSKISREEMSLKLHKSKKTIERDIEGIRKHLRLEFIGGKATGHWEVKCK